MAYSKRFIFELVSIVQPEESDLSQHTVPSSTIRYAMTLAYASSVILVSLNAYSKTFNQSSQQGRDLSSRNETRMLPLRYVQKDVLELLSSNKDHSSNPVSNRVELP